MAIDYRFVPWARRGLVRAVTTADAPELDARPRIALTLSLQADQDGAPAPPVSGQVGLRLFGPADVVGLDTRLILRTDPRPDATDFEPNYLALVDFDPPDLPWMFTPAQAQAQRLRPWLVLLVLDAAQVRPPKLQPGAPLPSITVPQAVAAQELPDLDESWMWAHAQATSRAAGADTLAAELQQQPQGNVSRLISPRRLQPSRDYLACLVPAFSLGVRRGLDLPLADAADAPLRLTPAWAAPFEADVVLPVYFHWRFSTGPAGDFETLARRIRTPGMLARDASLSQADRDALALRLKTLGTAEMAVDADRLLTDDGRRVLQRYEGALTSTAYDSPAKAPDEVPDKLQTIVNAPQTQLLGAGQPGRAPTVAPPLYGAWHARQHVVAAQDGRWLNDLNRDPRFRAAAGKGTAVVQAHQEAFMDACWGQVGEVLRTERALAQAALARQVQRVLHRRLAALPDDRLLAVAGPAASRLRVAAEATVLARIRSTSVPNAVADPALRRLTSAQRPLLKAAVRRVAGGADGAPGGAAALPVATQIAGMVQQLVQASRHPQAIDPNRQVPDGILGSASFDRLAVPDDPAALVDLAAIGLPGQLPAATLRALQMQGQAARQWYAKAAGTGQAWRPTLKARRDQGLMGEVHQIRLAQLAVAARAAQPVSTAALLRQVQATDGVKASEGLLLALNVQQGPALATVTPLRVDGRTGAIQALVAGPRQARPRGPRAGTTALAAAARVSVGAAVRQQVAQFGAGSLFTSLPVNSFPSALDGATGAPVAVTAAVDTALAGLFSAPGAALPPGVATVTVPPPWRDQATLARFTQALKAHNQLWYSPLDVAGVKVRAVDFPLARVADEVRRRTDPELTVPARLAARLGFGGSALAFDAATRQLSHPFVAHGLATEAQFKDVRFVVPRLFDRVMAYPRLEEPMSLPLARLDPEAMMPGAHAIPNDFLVLTRTNNRFVESFMVGVNHEMGRELLWRGFPTDQRGTPMRHFWDRLDDQPDIRELHLWQAQRALGTQPPADGGPPGDKLVLVIRATLVRRYPNLTVYAQRRKPGAQALAAPEDFTVAEPGITLPAELKMIVKRPVFAGPLPPDLVYVGFDIPIADPDQARAEVDKWCFVLEEQMTEPRFGFDEPDSRRAQPPEAQRGWKDVHWQHILPAGLARPFLRLSHLVGPAARPAWLQPLPAGAHSAHVAKALLQRPFRAYFVGRDLLP